MKCAGMPVAALAACACGQTLATKSRTCSGTLPTSRRAASTVTAILADRAADSTTEDGSVGAVCVRVLVEAGVEGCV